MAEGRGKDGVELTRGVVKMVVRGWDRMGAMGSGKKEGRGGRAVD